jgi:FtsZ-interacting cell division protein ZipA
LPAFDAVSLSSNNYKVRDLLFTMYLPHCPDPFRVIQYMVRAAKYTAKRLNGEILNELEKPFEWDEFEAEVKEVVEKLKDCGIVSGSPICNELF